MKMASEGIEELYKNYGILADAGDDVSQVSNLSVMYYSHIVAFRLTKLACVFVALLVFTFFTIL